MSSKWQSLSANEQISALQSVARQRYTLGQIFICFLGQITKYVVNLRSPLFPIGNKPAKDQ